MKTLAKINELLQEFEQKFGLPVRGMEQRSEAWFQVKLGVISASRFSEAVAKKESATRLTYMAELVAQVCTSVIEEQSFKQTEWGEQHEDAARSSYEFIAGVRVTPLGFAFKDNSFRVGCSPDGAIFPLKPNEIKCPWDTANYIKFLTEGIQKPEWRWQNQGTLYVLDADEIDVTQYDPRMKVKPIHSIIVRRDPEMQKKLEDTIPEFISDMDKMLKEIGVEFGDQWKRLAKPLEDVRVYA